MDDNPLQCAQVEMQLQQVGLQNITHAYSAHDALQKLRQQRHQIVILDLDMPETDGIQFINQLASEQLSPMLAISSSCSQRLLSSVGMMAKEKGFSVLGSFPKPFSSIQAHNMRDLIMAKAEITHAPQAKEKANVFDAASLCQGLRDDDIKAWFQPKKSLRTGHIIGAEALVRWIRADQEILYPGAFLQSIKHHDMEYELLLKMLGDGLQAHVQWQKLGYRIPISINLPVTLLKITDLPDKLHAITTQAGVQPEAICFELLEDDVLDALAVYHMGASRLRLKGFGLSQDDFGLGYSSMYNLISTPFTELKVDKAFVTDAWRDKIRAAALTSAIRLGHELKMTITAEGVESEQDMAFLRSIDCDCAQGFFISAAVDPERFAKMLLN
ncbi:EAL domain-containing response regulator [Comamonas composti]|uniref:EAL domain-containing response regulator n=1 Tax=Comamonas composti TaxID=408558 RepID=UPI001FE126FF|nr:EAL domain-containing response regulator [Comamonas composti]